MDVVRITLEGLDGVKRALEEMPRFLAQQTLRDAVDWGAKVVQQSIQQQAPHRTGRLQRSIIVQWAAGTALPGAIVLPNRRLFAKDSGRHAHLLEYGTKGHRNEGRFPGTWNPGIPAQPFFWSGFWVVEDEARRGMGEIIEDALAKYWSTAG